MQKLLGLAQEAAWQIGVRVRGGSDVYLKLRFGREGYRRFNAQRQWYWTDKYFSDEASLELKSLGYLIVPTGHRSLEDFVQTGAVQLIDLVPDRAPDGSWLVYYPSFSEPEKPKQDFAISPTSTSIQISPELEQTLLGLGCGSWSSDKAGCGRITCTQLLEVVAALKSQDVDLVKPGEAYVAGDSMMTDDLEPQFRSLVVANIDGEIVVFRIVKGDIDALARAGYSLETIELSFLVPLMPEEG